MLNRLAVLHLSDCHCTLSSPRLSDSAGREVYLRALHSLVSKTNDEVQWFTSNNTLCFLPVSTRWLISLQHALNILWLHGDNLDERTITSTSQPGSGTVGPLSSYTKLDNDYSSRFGLETLSKALPHVVRLTISIYDSTSSSSSSTSSKAPQHQHQSRTTIGHPSGSIDFTSLTSAEIIRLANISVRLSVAMDYVSTTDDCRNFTFESLSSLLLRRLDVHRQPSDCSTSSSSRPNIDIIKSPPQPQLSLPLSSSLSGSGPELGTGINILCTATTACDNRDADASEDKGKGCSGSGSGATSLERFGAAATAAETAGHSMQEWASELEKFLGPLFGL